jgi:hypothetical protein
VPIVINDFEVVPEPAPAPAQGTSAQSPKAEPPDVERLLAAHRTRAERTRAY